MLQVTKIGVEMNCDFEADCITPNEMKFGEIFIQTNQNFYIMCTFCIVPFTEFQEFITHCTHQHLHELINPLEINNEFGNIRDSPIFTTSLEKCPSDEENMEKSRNSNENDETINDKLKMISHKMSEIKESVKKNKSPILRRNQKAKNDFMNKSQILLSEIYKIDKYIQMNKTALRKDQEKDVQNFSCDICTKKFTSEIQFENHKKYHYLPFNTFEDFETIDIQICSLSDEIESEQDSNKQPELLLKEDPKKCKYCDREFDSNYKRVNHERIHTGEKPFKCKFCDKLFALKLNRKIHEDHHRGIKPYKCNMCDRAFVVKNNLKIHIRRHKGEKRYSCSYCEKKFCYSTEKTIHERTHTGEKPYQCNKCGQCFRTSSHLLYHTKRHHVGVIDKPHICDICNKGFSSTSGLKNHYAIHSDLRPFSCEICNKTFKLKKTLRTHMKIHSDTMQYTCNICGKGFKQCSGLYCHMKVHGESLK